MFAVVATIVTYVGAYIGHVSADHNAAWNNLIRARQEIRKGESGNWGQIAAIETLTRTCSSFWRDTVVEEVFKAVFGVCETLNSMSLPRMELGRLQAPYAKFFHSDLSCANLAQANLSNADVSNVDFHGANLRGTDLRAANLEAVDFRAAKLSWVYFDSKTKLDKNRLKCACLDYYPDGGAQIHKDMPAEFRASLRAAQAMSGRGG